MKLPRVVFGRVAAPSKSVSWMTWVVSIAPLSAAAKLAGLEKYHTTNYPRTLNGIEQLMERFTKGKTKEDVQAAMMRSELGDLYPAYKTVQDFRKNSGIMARLPFEIEVK